MLRNSFQRDLIEDPFFAAHRNHMMSMGSMFQMPDPFGAPQITDARIAERERRSQERRVQRQLPLQVSPFGMGMMPLGFGGMLANMDRMMSDMHSRFEQPMRCPTANGANYVQSSFVSYSNVGNGSPRVYQSSVTQRAQGGAVETKRSERDTTTGVEKVEIGHKIGEREHKVEKSRNRLTGENNVNQEFINIDEEEAGNFDQEFQDRVRHTTMPVRATAEYRRHRVNPTNTHGHSHMQSITAGHTHGSTPHRSNSASQRSDSASQRPVPASQRPVSASQRPVSASQRPVSASHRHTATSHRPGSASQRAASASQRLASATNTHTDVKNRSGFAAQTKIVGSSPGNRLNLAGHTPSVSSHTHGASSRHNSTPSHTPSATQQSNITVGHTHSPASHTYGSTTPAQADTNHIQDGTNEPQVDTSQNHSTTGSSNHRPSQRNRTPLLILPPSRYKSRREYR